MTVNERRPWVRKMAGAWVWRCHHGYEVGEEYWPDRWRDPWTAAYAAARRHAEGYHGGTVVHSVDVSVTPSDGG